MILYLHGFRSSPNSRKATLLRERLRSIGRADEYVCPALPASPRAAAGLARELAARAAPEALALIGSSLGGYYATWVAEQLGCRAVLLNPALAKAADPPQMAAAFARAVEAGRMGFDAGLMPRRDMAAPSTPVAGTPFFDFSHAG